MSAAQSLTSPGGRDEKYADSARYVNQARNASRSAPSVSRRKSGVPSAKLSVHSTPGLAAADVTARECGRRTTKNAAQKTTPAARHTSMRWFDEKFMRRKRTNYSARSAG